MNDCFSVLALFVIAGICGSIAKAMTGYSHGGCLASIALGLIGAMLGGWIAGAANLPDVLELNIGGQPFPVIWSIIGAVIFSAVLAIVTRRPPPRT